MKNCIFCLPTKEEHFLLVANLYFYCNPCFRNTISGPVLMVMARQMYGLVFPNYSDLDLNKAGTGYWLNRHGIPALSV